MMLWRDLYERQRARLERILNGQRSAAARRQALLSRSIAGLSLGVYAAEDVASCAYVGRLVQSAGVCAVKIRHAPTFESIYVHSQPLIYAFQPSLAATPDGVLPPRDHILLSGMPEYTQMVLSQAAFQKILRDALRADDFLTQLLRPPKPW